MSLRAAVALHALSPIPEAASLDPETLDGVRPGSIEEQLITLYAEKELLEKTLGTSDPTILIAMVQSMEEQLVALYDEKVELGV